MPPRKKKVDTKGMSAAQYKKMFGRAKPGPKASFKKISHAKKTAVAAAPAKQRKKPGPKPGSKRKKTEAAPQALSFTLVKQFVSELEAGELKELRDFVESKLEASIDTDDFTDADWEAVEQLVHSKGYKRDEALMAVRATKDDDEESEGPTAVDNPMKISPEDDPSNIPNVTHPSIPE